MNFITVFFFYFSCWQFYMFLFLIISAFSAFTSLAGVAFMRTTTTVHEGCLSLVIGLKQDWILCYFISKKMTQKLRNNRTPPEKALWRTSSLYISYSNVLRILRGFIQPSTDGLDLAKLVMTTISAIITKVIRCQPVLSLMMWCCLGHRDDWDSCLVYWHSVRSLYISVCIYVCMYVCVVGLWARWYRGWQNGLRPITTLMKQARHAAHCDSAG